MVLFDPASPLYPLLTRTRGAPVRWVGTRLEGGRLRPPARPPRRRLAHAQPARARSTPANPTGGVIAAEDLEQITWWAARRDVLIVSDEVFDASSGRPISVATLAAIATRGPSPWAA
ncbi:MAG: hypothetical protein U0797_29965 [Gemmataceae bacterium]